MFCSARAMVAFARIAGKTTLMCKSQSKKISFDPASLHALQLLALDKGVALQQLADEAFADLLRKHLRPVGLRNSLLASVRMAPANDRTLEGNAVLVARFS